MSACAGEHLDRLLWYADGRLTGEEAAAIEAHLAVCWSCARDAGSLRSMMRSIRAQAQTDHVPSQDLIAFADGSKNILGRRAASIADHLRGCRECAEDLDLLRRAERVERGEPVEAKGSRRPIEMPAPAPRRRLHGIVAAILVIAAGALIWQLARLTGPTAQPRETSTSRIVLAPAQRGASPAARVEGAGPVVLEVLLPFRAPRSLYRARIHPSARPEETVLQAYVSPDGDGRLLLHVPGFPAPGHHLLTLEPAAGGSDAYVYGIDVVLSP